ncbi:MAG: tetraacyldisaccharide 4'-kinase, partial [candidate division Zixibacteria bacterium]|nr:tetraacyldisaccharide 4'-kinase [candidate division Zixibacteria bacterium]
MEAIWENIISNKANPLYWPAVMILMVVSILYQLGLLLRKTFRSKPIKTKATVISVGNLTVGGTGKTPVAIFLANYYLGKGKTVGIVSSGYGRQIKTNICDTGQEISQFNLKETGDELMEMAENLPNVYFSVAKSKTDAALRLEKKYQVDIIIIDDGFQHQKLYRSLNILLIDANYDLRNESIFPLGRLRENLSAGNRADLILLTKANYTKNNNNFCQWLKNRYSDKPMAKLFFINNILVSNQNEISLDSISTRSCYLFAGIGNFHGLQNYIKQNLTNLIGWRQFSDQCQYNQAEIDKIKNDLEKYQPEFIITTYKDYVKLKDFN